MFEPPTPNCGHPSATFTWNALGEIFLCVACTASIGRLGDRCARCGSYAARGTRLVDVRHVGLVCFACRAEHLRSMPRSAR